MARLTLSLDGQTLAEFNMTRERYTIGRLADNDIRIDSAAVSGHHALIINILNDSFLEDLNSTNGTYVGGRLIRKHALQHGDVITIGHHQLRFVDADEADADRESFEKRWCLPRPKRPRSSCARAANRPAPWPRHPPGRNEPGPPICKCSPGRMPAVILR
jgi:predicted component of type VI protein secretion system